MPMKNKSRSLIRAASLAVPLSASLIAQTATWDGGGGDNNFNTGLNWAGDTAPTADTVTAYTFDGSTRLSPVLNGGTDWRASSIIFASGAGSFNVQGVATTLGTRFSNVGGAMSVTQNSANAQTVGAVLLSGGNSLSFGGSGSGTLTIGAIRQAVSGSSVVANRAVTFSSGFYTSPLTTANLTYVVGSTASGNITFNSDPFAGLTGGTRLIRVGAVADGVGGVITVGSDFTTAGAVNIRSGYGVAAGEARITGTGAATFSGALTFEGSSARTLLVNNTSTAGTTFSGTTTLGGASTARVITFNVGSDSRLNLSGTVQDNAGNAGGLIKFGAGVLALDGANTYTGATNLSGGTTLALSDKAFGDTSSLTINNASASLDVRGNTAGTVTLGSGADFSLSAGTVTLQLGSSFDQIVSSGSGSFNITGGTLVLDVGGVGFSYLNTYQILSGFGGINSVSGLTITGFDDSAYSAVLSTDGLLSFSAIPEPSSFAILAGLGVLGMAALRRRRDA